jgi:parallel beta-helix repeat protein
MSKKTVPSLLTWLLLSIITFTILFCPVPVSAKTLLVPQGYSTIQEAINAAHKGDIIQVSAGTYNESLIINQEIKLIGENKTSTIIDCQQAGDVIRVDVGSVTITGFTIRNGDNGIRVLGTIGSINVTDNIIKNNRYGISLLGDSITPTTDNIIVDNTFENNSNVAVSIGFGLSNTISKNEVSESAYGMKLALTNTTTISDNCLTSNSYGVYLNRCTNNSLINNIGIDNSFCAVLAYSDNIIIRNNRISRSTYAIQLYDSHSNTLLYNFVSDNPTYGIYMVYSDNNNVTDNTVSRSDWGLTLYDSLSNTVKSNVISYNTYGITTTTSPNNIIFQNDFIENVDQITRDFLSINTWSQNERGNYWSDYQGVDDGSGGRVAGDGVGDTFIPHLGEDNYPLMNPVHWLCGDFDGDGDVDWFDFGIFAAAYGSSEGDSNFLPEADFNGDGNVDWFDFAIFASNYGVST